MNKAEFVKHIAEQHQSTQVEAEKTIDMFTSWELKYFVELCG